MRLISFIWLCPPHLAYHCCRLVESFTFWAIFPSPLVFGQATSLAGKEALEKLCIVLHLSEDQDQDVTQELWERGFYG